MDYKAESDEWLMEHVQQGRQDCLEPLVRRHANGLLTYLQRMVSDRQLAEDLFQDAFLAVWAKRDTYRPGRPFRRWLYAIATNACRLGFRQSQRIAFYSGSPLMEPSIVSSEPSPQEAAVGAEQKWQIAQVVAGLPEQQRMVLVLRNWHQLPYDEIAEIVGCSPATVRSHMHHALTNLRKSWESRWRPVAD